MAMNGWAAPEPAWWLNLHAHLDPTLDMADRSLAVRGRVASGEEHERLWARWQEHGDDVERYATHRPTETAVVVLERQAVLPVE